jgi:mono/diheme cytochrome c family protein
MDQRLRILTTAVSVSILLASCGSPEPAPEAGTSAPPRFVAAQVARGAQLAAVGNCISCHTAPGGKPYAGGYSLHTPFGTVHGSNITPDPETGIGRWSLADFERAMRQGVSPRGHHYYPAFPYDYFTRLGDADIAALYAFVMTREPVNAAEAPNRMLVPRVAVAIWKSRYFHPGRFQPDAGRDARWNRGAYLAESLAHCSACHTPRDRLGGEKRDEYMSGGEADGWHAPALNRGSPSPTPWDTRKLSIYLSTGLVADHAITAGPMAPVVRNLSHAARDDVDALAHYIVSLMAGAPATGGARATAKPQAQSEPLVRGAALYAGACAECHERGRDAEGGALQLERAIALSLPTPANLIHIVRDGIVPLEHEAQPWMPAYRGALTVEQTTDLVAYLRTLSGKPPWPDVAGDVRKIEGDAK